MKHREQAQHIRNHASKKLRTNLRILSVVYGVLLVMTLYRVIASSAIFWQVVLAMIIGVLVGVVSARMYKIAWDTGEAKVVGKMDIYGIVVLVLFVVFELERGWIAQLFASADAVGTISLVLLTGALFGRVMATSRRIMQIIRGQGLL